VLTVVWRVDRHYELERFGATFFLFPLADNSNFSLNAPAQFQRILQRQ
jgi:hypothetical protein